jgi:hypothetical protein
MRNYSIRDLDWPHYLWCQRAPSHFHGYVPHGSMVYPHSKHCVLKFKTLHNPFSPATISIYIPFSESKHYIKDELTRMVWISLKVPELSIDKNRTNCLHKGKKNKCQSMTINYLCILCSNTGLENPCLIIISVYLMMFPVVQTVQHQMTGWLVSNELERIGKEEAAKFRALSRNLPGETK